LSGIQRPIGRARRRRLVRALAVVAVAGAAVAAPTIGQDVLEPPEAALVERAVTAWVPDGYGWALSAPIAAEKVVLVGAEWEDEELHLELRADRGDGWGPWVELGAHDDHAPDLDPNHDPDCDDSIGLCNHRDFDGDNVGVFWDGKELNGLVAKRIVHHVERNEGYDALKNFLTKALSGKDEKRMDNLFRFVEKNNLPIHPDGDVLAFKAVRPDGKDTHFPSRILYELGKYVEQENFDESPHNLCSTGLHIGGRSYVKSFGRLSDDKFFIVKVDPNDFVSYVDTEWGKARVRKMFVYGETEGLTLDNCLTVLVATVPTGDQAEQVARQGREQSQRAKQQRSQRSQREQRARRGVQTPVFQRSGQSYTAAQITSGVAQHGQRGYAAMTGIPRSTIQEWLKQIRES
jgi:hypothetical protein